MERGGLGSRGRGRGLGRGARRPNSDFSNPYTYESRNPPARMQGNSNGRYVNTPPAPQSTAAPPRRPLLPPLDDPSFFEDNDSWWSGNLEEVETGPAMDFSGIRLPSSGGSSSFQFGGTPGGPRGSTSNESLAAERDYWRSLATSSSENAGSAETYTPSNSGGRSEEFGVRDRVHTVQTGNTRSAVSSGTRCVQGNNDPAQGCSTSSPRGVDQASIRFHLLPCETQHPYKISIVNEYTRDGFGEKNIVIRKSFTSEEVEEAITSTFPQLEGVEINLLKRSSSQKGGKVELCIFSYGCADGLAFLEGTVRRHIMYIAPREVLWSPMFRPRTWRNNGVVAESRNRSVDVNSPQMNNSITSSAVRTLSSNERVPEGGFEREGQRPPTATIFNALTPTTGRSGYNSSGSSHGMRNRSSDSTRNSGILSPVTSAYLERNCNIAADPSTSDMQMDMTSNTPLQARANDRSHFPVAPTDYLRNENSSAAVPTNDDLRDSPVRIGSSGSGQGHAGQPSPTFQVREGEVIDTREAMQRMTGGASWMVRMGPTEDLADEENTSDNDVAMESAPENEPTAAESLLSTIRIMRRSREERQNCVARSTNSIRETASTSASRNSLTRTQENSRESLQHYFRRKVRANATGERDLTVIRDEMKITFLDPYIALGTGEQNLFAYTKVKFEGEQGLDMGGLSADYFSEVRESIMSGTYRARPLIEFVGNYKLLSCNVFEPFKTFFALGLAFCDLAFQTGFAIEGFSNSIIAVLQCLTEGKPPIVVVGLEEVFDDAVVEGFDQMTKVVTGEAEFNCLTAFGKIHDAFEGKEVFVPRNVSKYDAIILRQQMLFNFVIGRRVDCIGGLYEGMKAGGLITFLLTHPWEWKTIFPREGETEVTAQDVMAKIEFAGDYVDELRKVVYEYLFEIAQNKAMLQRFWRMCTGEDAITLSSSRQSFRIFEGSTIEFATCGGDVLVPRGITAEHFAATFCSDFKTNKV